jgi:hypothetical protein
MLPILSGPCRQIKRFKDLSSEAQPVFERTLFGRLASATTRRYLARQLHEEESSRLLPSAGANAMLALNTAIE